MSEAFRFSVLPVMNTEELPLASMPFFERSRLAVPALTVTVAFPSAFAAVSPPVMVKASVVSETAALSAYMPQATFSNFVILFVTVITLFWGSFSSTSA